MVNFNFPSVDHLIRGVDYEVIDWDFAEEDFLRNQQTNMPSRGMASTFADSQEKEDIKEEIGRAHV